MTDWAGSPEDCVTGAPAGGALEMAARLAATLLNTPLAAVSTIDGAGVWVNACEGLADEWRSRAFPDFAAVIQSEGVFTRTYAPGKHPISGVRFMAALAFTADSCAGLILVLDRRPRNLSMDEKSTLESLQSLVLDALRLRAGVRRTPDNAARFTLDLDGKCVSAEGSIDQTGYSDTDLIGTEFLDRIPVTHREEWRERLMAQLGGCAGRFDVPFQTRQGDVVLMTVRTRLLFDRGRPAGIEACCRDITSVANVRELRREAENKLEAKTAQVARLNENLRELQRLSVTKWESIESLCADYLASGCVMFGLDRGSISDGDGIVLASFPPQAGNPFEPVLTAPLHSGERRFGMLSFGSSSGHDVAAAEHADVVELMARSIAHALEADELRQQRDALNRHLEGQLRRDALTGLPNRLGLFEKIDQLARGAGPSGRFALLFIDLDRFKQINDTLGHAGGDQLLRECASRLHLSARPAEFVSRVGGDEFAVVIAGNPARMGIEQSARRFLEVIRAPYSIHGCEVFVTASIGASLYPRHGAEANILLQRADSAMYRVKNSGKNDVQFFSPAASGRTSNSLELETQLRRAIDNGELDIRFQPILTVEGSLDGLEVLLSWDNPKLGKVGPAEFIPVAEESGMIVPIGRWVLEHACMQSKAWREAGFAPPRISVNVSPLQFTRTDFVDMVAGALEQTGVPPQCLELELTESLVMRNVEETVRRMSLLRQLGISLSIDDFGTGYSSLSYLNRLPVDSLKIDRSFLADLTSSAASVPLIQTIVVLAHNIGLSVVAEGVETAEQLAVLRTIGCDKVQGHLLGEPLRAPEVARLFPRPKQR